MKQKEQWRFTDRVVADHVEWWADHVERRLLGIARLSRGDKTGAPKEPWDPDRDRARFVRYLSTHAPDYEGADELADKFERAITEANGNPARFRLELERALY